MSDLGSVTATGVLRTDGLFTPGTSLWVVRFEVEKMPREAYEVWHGALRGPGGYFLVYLDRSFYGVGENGLINEYAPAQAMYVRPGRTISLNWSIASGAAPMAELWLREPEVGRI